MMFKNEKVFIAKSNSKYSMLILW